MLLVNIIYIMRCVRDAVHILNKSLSKTADVSTLIFGNLT
jgi:hypothetical protein